MEKDPKVNDECLKMDECISDLEDLIKSGKIKNTTGFAKMLAKATEKLGDVIEESKLTKEELVLKHLLK